MASVTLAVVMVFILSVNNIESVKVNLINYTKDDYKIYTEYSVKVPNLRACTNSTINVPDEIVVSKVADPYGQHRFEIGFDCHYVKYVNNRYNYGDLVVPFWLYKKSEDYYETGIYSTVGHNIECVPKALLD